MKILFLSLFLLNIGYLGYNVWMEQASGTEPTGQSDTGIPELRLVGEEQAAKTASADTSAKSEDTTASAEEKREEIVAQCHVVGPMPSAGQLNTVWEQARDNGIQEENRWSEETEMPRYWVYIPPAEDMGQARRTLQRLEDRNINDIQLINSGRMARGISLGLFSTASAAERRESHIRVQGFNTAINEVAVQAEGHWLALRTASGEPIAQTLLKKMTRGVEGAEIVQRPCDELRA